MRKSDLKYFGEILQERKKQILRNLEDKAKEIEGLNGQNLSDDLDYATLSAETTVTASISLQQQKELEEINIALQKLERSIFGICEMCEEPISIPRLKVKPQARYCIVCRELIEKERERKRGATK